MTRQEFEVLFKMVKVASNNFIVEPSDNSPGFYITKVAGYYVHAYTNLEESDRTIIISDVVLGVHDLKDFDNKLFVANCQDCQPVITHGKWSYYEAVENAISKCCKEVANPPQLKVVIRNNEDTYGTTGRNSCSSATVIDDTRELVECSKNIVTSDSGMVQPILNINQRLDDLVGCMAGKRDIDYFKEMLHRLKIEYKEDKSKGTYLISIDKNHLDKCYGPYLEAEFTLAGKFIKFNVGGE